MVWGCGALMIREVVHRWRGGWTSILVLGLGWSIVWEFIIQQTSLSPLPWLSSTPVYGRVWDVNWIWSLFMLGYEAVWIVLVPILLTELIFPQRRDEAWLRPAVWLPPPSCSGLARSSCGPCGRSSPCQSFSICQSTSHSFDPTAWIADHLPARRGRRTASGPCMRTYRSSPAALRLRGLWV
jgi:hypothetical protein